MSRKKGPDSGVQYRKGVGGEMGDLGTAVTSLEGLEGPD